MRCWRGWGRNLLLLYSGHNWGYGGDGMTIKLGDIILYIGGNTDGLDQALEDARKRTGAWGGNLAKTAVKAAGAAIVAGVGVAAAGAVMLGRAAYTAFEDTRLTLNDVRVSFGETAQEWVSWSGEMQDATTFSDEAFMNAATNMRTLIANYGLGEDQVRDLITASADLATVKGLDLVEATERVQSAIRGEAEASEYLGLTLNDTYMKNMAFEGALQDTWETLTDAEKAQYRYQEALNQMAYAQGEAEAATETWAGSMAQIKNIGQDMLAGIGEQIVSIVEGYGPQLVEWMETAAAWLETKLPEAAATFKVWLEETLPAAIETLKQKLTFIKDNFAAVAGVILGVVVPAFLLWATTTIPTAVAAALAWIVAAAPAAAATLAMALPFIALGVAIVALGLLWNKYGEQVTTTMQQLQFIVQFKLAEIKANWTSVWENLKTIVSTVWTNITTTIGTKLAEAKTKVSTILEQIKTFISTFSLQEVGTQLVQGLIDGIKSMAQGAIDAAGAVIQGAIDKVTELIQPGSPSRVFAEIGATVTAGLAKGIADTADGPIRAAGGMAEAATAAARGAVTSVEINNSVSVDAQVSDRLDIEDLANRVSEILAREVQAYSY